MAITQPLLELYGKNVTIFSAAKLTSIEVALFIGVAAVAPAIICIFIDRFSASFGPKVNEAARLVMIAGLSFLLGFAVARWIKIDGNISSSSIAVAFGIAIPISFDRSKAIRVWSRWLSVLSIAVVISAVVAAWPVLIETNGPTSDAVVGNKNVTVLQVIFDEFPLYSLLDSEGGINAVRFPGFAELAQDSTWYRNSVAESNFTHQAVPAILSSQIPKQSGGPFLAQYPKNIFTLFGGRTSVGGIEPVTSLCPHSVCAKREQGDEVFDADRVKTFFRDAMYVYGHRVFPQFIRKHIPSIEGTWGGFGVVANQFRGQFATGALSQVDAVDQAVHTITGDNSPQVQVVHALLPHAPWRITPDLRVDDLSATISTVNPDDDEVIRDMYQTFLYQVGAADRVIQNLIHELKASGKWDSVLLVITADHGISFVPTLPQRHTDFSDSGQVADIYRIPTFIKYPKQTAGRTDDCAMSNLDLLPTIIEATQTKTSWNFSGQSIAKTCPTGRVRHVISATGQSVEMSGAFEEARSRALHYSEIVSNTGPLTQVAAVGESAALVGSVIGKAPVGSQVAHWTLNQKDLFAGVSSQRGTRVPALVTGTITTTKPLEAGTEGIVVVDGIAAGVIGELSGARNTVGYTAVLDYSLLTAGSHTVQLYVRDIDGKLTSAGLPD